MSNFYFNKTPQKIIKWAIDNSFEGIEVWAEAPFFYADNSNLEIFKEFERASTKLEYSMHAPFYDINIASINPGILKESLRQLKKIIGWADYFPVDRIILHTGKTVSQSEFVMEKVREIVFNSFEELIKEAVSKNIELLIENIGINKYDFDNNVEELKNIIDRFDLSMCLDAGHANITWGNETNIRAMAKHVRQLHVNDNFGEYDQHLPVGDGNIDWRVYKDLVEKIPVIHEIQCPNNPEEATLRSRNKLERLFHMKQ
jgi:sugar phosphate isomerase/epimerase